MVAAATALVAGVMTILMGVVANYPLALATGLGLNAFVAFGIAKLPEMTWADAMGLVVIEGLIITRPRAHRLPAGGLPARSRPSSRPRSASASACSSPSSASSTPASSRKPAGGPVPVELGIGGFLNGWPLLVFVVGLLAIIVMMVRG